MSDKPKVKGLIERKLEDPEYRKRHDERYAAFKLEAQILTALEEKNWTYDQLAKATGTSKSNVSRDLKAGGIWAASFFRIHRIAEALGMKLVALMIPQEMETILLPKFEQLVREPNSAVLTGVSVIQTWVCPVKSEEDQIFLTGTPISNFLAPGFEAFTPDTKAITAIPNAA